MRVLKIVLILFSLATITAIVYILIQESGNFSFATASNKVLSAYVYMLLLLILAILNIIYQIKTFRIYRKESKRNLDKKVSKFFWVVAISFNFFLLLPVLIGLYNNWRRYWYGNFNGGQLLFMSILFILTMLGFLEISILKKRIKRLKAAKENKDEIETIGNIEV